MSEQIFQQPKRREESEIAQLPQQHTPLDLGLDEILDDIDSILETNAESFVQGFVQKGGQ